MPEIELRTDAEYEAALAEIDRLLELEPEKGSPEHEEVDRLRTLVEKYEVRRLLPSDPDDLPVDADEA